jgi:hypothetical protein
LKKYLQLALLILRSGKLNSSGQDFNRSRAESLEGLQEFIPSQCVPRSIQALKSSNNLRAQAAFIKAAFRNKGGHVTAGSVGYIRIPKAANTSIGYAMLVKKYPELKNKTVDETQVNFLSDLNLSSVHNAGTETFFTVVRNPFARLVSVYRDFFENAPLATPQAEGKFMYEDYLFGILKQNMSFAEFVERISKIPDRLKDQHFKPQHLFFKPYAQNGIAVKIFQLEEKQSLESFLNDHGMELTHRNKSAEPYAYAEYYTPALIEKVYQLYRKDVERFGYDEILQSLKQELPV